MDYDLRKGSDRRGPERRRGSDPAYSGPERRQADRRASERRRRESVAPSVERPSRWPWLLVAGAMLMAWDAFAWDSYYRRHVMYEINHAASDTRSWSANVWKLS